jgi:YetA-like protein
MHIPILATPGGAESSQEPRRGEPLTFGVPLPRGFASDVAGWTFGPAGGPQQFVQARVLDQWPDGSVRWALVDVQADLAPGPTQAFSIGAGAGVPKALPPSTGLSLTESGGLIGVDTGVTRFEMRAGGRFPFESVSTKGHPALDATASGLDITDVSGVVHRVTAGAIKIEERGPLRSVVRLTAAVTVSGGRQSLLLSARLHFYAGLPAVRLLLTLTNPDRAVHQGGFWDLGDPGSVRLKDVTLSCALPKGTGDVSAYASRERADGQWAPVELPFEIYQDSSGGENWQGSNHINRERRIPNTFRGYRVRSGQTSAGGLRATPIVGVRRADAGIAATLPHFWQNFPKAIEVQDASLAVRLFPGQYADLHELQGGEQKTHECVVSFGPDPVTSTPLAWARERTVVSVAPDWCLSARAVPFLAPLEGDHAALAGAAVDGPGRFDLKREVVDEYGWRHFGELYSDHEGIRRTGPPPLVSHYNNQYDTVAGLGCQFLRTADPRWWHLMTELAAHVIDIDVYRTDRDKSAYNHGLFWHTYHYGDADTATHRTYPKSAQGHIHGGGPSADHNYTSGLMLHYFLTGDDASRATVIDLARFVIDMDDGTKSVFRWLDRGDTGRAALSAPGYYGPGRAPANSLSVLLDGYRLSGDRRFLDKAERLLRRVIHPNEDIAFRRLDVPELRWFYTMFLQSLGKYLDDKVERGQLDEMYAFGRASLLHYARWMADHEHPYLEKPEKLEFPTETWAAQDIRKSDVFYFAALYASGDERARFLERAEFFHKYSTSTLLAQPTHTLLRPIVVLLSSGYMRSWFTRQADAQAPQPATTAAFGSPEMFVPQKERAMRRAMLLAGAGGLVTVGWLLFVLAT